MLRDLLAIGMEGSGRRRAARRKRIRAGGLRNFACTACGQRIYFENSVCLRCKNKLGFLPDDLDMVALQPLGNGLFRINGKRDTRTLAYCANAEHEVCNWLTVGDDPARLCEACALNRMIPNLSEAGNLVAWRDFERAKKRLVYSLLRFELPFNEPAEGKGPLAFDFVQNAMTGHLDGLITIDVMEADAVERERQRQHFGEPYRSLLGHLRHESGHYYWMLLVEAAGRQEDFRALFGDERVDYSAALARHHAEGPPPDWADTYVSAYGSAHPWEDWAETWALYMHMVDSIDTADAEGVEPHTGGIASNVKSAKYDVFREGSFRMLTARWVPLTIALNNLGRSLGYADFYPFIIPVAGYRKLEFVHDLIRGYRRTEPHGSGPAAH